MTKFFAISFVIILAAACAAPAPLEPRATEAEKTAASHAYLACMFGAADKTDDHVSDGTTIARAIIGLCRAEFLRWESLELKGEGTDESEGTIAGLEQGQLGVALNVVLRERQLARDGKHPSSN